MRLVDNLIAAGYPPQTKGRFKMKRFTTLLGLAVLFLASVVWADVPKLINFQGILRDGSGNPVPDAVYTVRVRIYDDSTAGSTLWEETVPVPTASGLFNVRLGDATALPHNLFSAGVNRFVGIKVNLDPEMAPRTRLISVPYAFHALRSDSAATATVALDLTCTGCVGTSDIDATQVQRRVTGTAPPNEYITAINQDGSVTTAVDQAGAASGWTDDGTAVRLTDGTDKVGIGTATPASQPGLENTHLEIADANGLNSDVSLRVSGGGATGSAGLNFAKSRGTLSSPTSVQSGDFLGNILFLGHDGTDFGSIAAWIQASVDGTPGANDMPGRLEFKTTADGSATPTTRMMINNAGNVGIGTVGPGSRLQVEGQIASSVTGAAAPGFTFTGDLNTGLFETIPDELGLATSGLDRLHITSSGNVGIGNSTPTKKLDVAGSVKADTVFSNILSSNSPLSLQAPAGTTRMYIDDLSGDVGLGTTTPARNLHIFQDVNSSIGLRIDNPNVGGAAQERIDFGSSGLANISVFGASNRMAIVNNRTSGAVEFEVGGTQRLFIGNSGNVGIGTTGPNKKLEVVGSVKADTVFSNFLSSNSPLSLQAPAGTTRMYINDMTGNVGIGTVGPGSRLQVEGQIASSVTGAAAPGFTFTGDLNTGLFETIPDEIGLATSGLDRLHITSGGNVGIGIITPTKKLDVAGSVKADTVFSNVLSSNSPLSLQAPAGTTRMHIDDVGGNVSIGTTTSSGTLTIFRSTFPSLSFDDAGATVWSFTHDGSHINMNESGATRTRFRSGGDVHFGITGGNVGIGTTSPLTPLHVAAAGADVATFNRNTNDGIIVRLDQGGLTEGTISVAGATVSYNAFTGSHYGWTEEAIECGELVALTGINRNSHDNPKSEIIYGIKPSSIPNDPACLGSYLALAEPSKTASSENPHLVMAVGNGDMWVVDEGQNIQPGDYLISSSTPGHAMKDDEAKYPIGHIVARAAEGVDWGSVGEMVGGRKHKKISVLFGNFVRSNPSTVAQSLEGLKEIILKQQKEIEELKKVVLKDGSSVMAETKR